MKKYGLLGRNLSHSYSAQIHKRYFELKKMNCGYELLEKEPDVLCEEFKKLSRDYCGINVTVPYKNEVFAYLDNVSETAEKIGAVNTVKFDNGLALGYNTDYYGLKLMLEVNGVNLKNKSVSIFGTGGAAKAVCALCLDCGVSDITFVSRNNSVDGYKTLGYNDTVNADVVFNATPVGMYPDTDSCAAKNINPQWQYAVDLIYNPYKTAFLKKCENAGIKTLNGLYMLVAQALFSESIWNNEIADVNCVNIIYNELCSTFKGSE